MVAELRVQLEAARAEAAREVINRQVIDSGNKELTHALDLFPRLEVGADRTIPTCTKHQH